MKKFIALMLVTFSVFVFSGCISYYVYPNGKDYAFGNAEISDKISSLDIDWLSCDVEVSYYDGSTVSVSETYNGELVDANKLHYFIDKDSTLLIKFTASGKINLKAPNKKLTVLIPRDMALNEINISTASADIKATDLSAKEIDIETASGDIEAVLKNTDSVELSSSSGKINAKLTDIGSVDLESASGNNTVVINGETESIDFDSASGKLDLTLEKAKELSVESSSGNIKISCLNVPEKTEIDVSSASVTLLVPENSDFTAEIDTASGDFDCDFPVIRKGNTYVSGNGGNSVEIESASGDIVIAKYVTE